MDLYDIGGKEIRNKILVSAVITFLFLICHQSNNEIQNSNIPRLRDFRSDYTSQVFHRREGSNLIKIFNPDVSLSAPYLDKINKHWFVGGSTTMRNHGLIKLTNAGSTNTFGVLLSNGIGDNIISNFETTYDFKLSNCRGNGVAFVISSENGFVWKDLLSSFARKQYIINSNGVIPNDFSMMGFPKNLPGLAVILNTSEEVPYFDIVLNQDPNKHSYAFESNVEQSTSIKINHNKIRMSNKFKQGQRIKLRIIYMESIKLLKIDILYNLDDQWEQLYIKHDLEWILPKNEKRGERYIGIGSLSKDKSQTAEIHSIRTNEFHWRNSRDEKLENGSDTFKNDIFRFIEEEYGIAQQSMVTPISRIDTQNKTSHGHFWIALLIIFIILIIIYTISIYVRVIKKHILKLRKKQRKRRRKESTLLPI